MKSALPEQEKQQSEGPNTGIGTSRLSIERAKLIARSLNATGIVMAVLLFFFPVPYGLLMLVGMILPLLVLVLVYRGGGLIRLQNTAGGTIPTVLYAFVLPCLGVCIRSFMDFEILEYSSFWVPFLVISVLLGCLTFFTTSRLEKGARVASVAPAVFFLLFYASGVVVHINCYYDSGEPKIFEREVLSMRISESKTTMYYVTLEPWGPVTERQEFGLDMTLYDQLAVGDEVKIHLQDGRLGIPWYYLTK